MTMQSSGPISIGQAAQECRESLFQNHAGDGLLSRLAGVSPGQKMAWSYWYGKSYGYSITEVWFSMNGGTVTTAMAGSYGGGASAIIIAAGSAAATNPYNGTFSASSPGAVDVSPAGFQRRGYDPAYPGSLQTIPFSDQFGRTGYIDGVMRVGNVLNIFARGAASMDGIVVTTSIGESLTLSIDHAITVINPNDGSDFTVYSVDSPVYMGSRSYTMSLVGIGQRPRPQFYVPPAPPPGGGGGGGGGCCFIAGSKVLMANGSWKQIEYIRANDLVMSPTGPAIVKDLYVSTLGTHRKFMTFAEDRSTIWSQEHPFWSRRNGQQWWWADRPDLLREEMETGLIAGLKDRNSVYGGQVDDYAYLGEGFVRRTPIVLEGYSADTPVYIPILDGPPAIVNGYVVGAFLDESQYDYARLDWNQLYPTLAAKGFAL